MKGIIEVESQGRRGPAFIRFSNEPVARTEPWPDDEDLVVDYDAVGQIVGIELVDLRPDVIGTLVDVARRNDLDLRALVSQSFHTSPAA